MCNLATKDVLELAKAITEDPVEYMDSDSGSYYYCNFCESELNEHDKSTGEWYNMKNFKHELTCPVLIAQDILTGYR